MLYKVTDEQGAACHGGLGQWALPHDGHPGDWMPVIARPVPCERGYHLCREADLIHWLGPVIWEAEVAPDAVVVEGGTKIVCSSARLMRRVETWTERTARLFAADCAEAALPIFEERYPADTRPRKAIAAARAFARGEIAEAWAESAANAAANTAAEAWAESAANAAAWSAARSAARSAVWSAANAAAWSAANAAQTVILFEYLRGERT